MSCFGVLACGDDGASPPSDDAIVDASVDRTPMPSNDAAWPPANDVGNGGSRDGANTADGAMGDAGSGGSADAPRATDGALPTGDVRDAARETGVNADAGAAPDAEAGIRDASVDMTSMDAPRDTPGDVAPRPDSGPSDAGLAPITIWIAGDSTVQTYPAGNTSGVGGASLEGWGQELAPFFNDKVTISNQAIGGRSVAFFMWNVKRDAAGAYVCTDANGTPDFELDAQGNRTDTAQWARIKNGIKPGDYVLAQFGTNDRAKACPKYVNLADFETYFGMLGDAVRAKGGIPIFVTPMGQRSFTGTTPNNGLAPYAEAMKRAGATKSVPIADLNLRSIEYYAMVGDAYLAANIFDTGSTHFVKAGAIKMASLVAGEIRANGGGLAAYLK